MKIIQILPRIFPHFKMKKMLRINMILQKFKNKYKLSQIILINTNHNQYNKSRN